MNSGKQSLAIKSNKINFVKHNINKEECKDESSESTYASKSFSFSRHKLFLDYTFQENKNKLLYQKNNEKLINNIKAKNYYYEIQKTFLLNIDLLLYYYNNKKNEAKNNDEIIKLLNNIKNKEKQKTEIKISIKQKCNYLISKYDNLYSYNNKIENQINIYNIKINNKLVEINYLNTYISLLNKRFSYVDIYINKLRFINEGRKGLKHKRNKLTKFIEKNSKNNIKIKEENNIIKKIKTEISELKKDNKLSKRQNRLIKEKNPDINLIRVVEFYIRIIRTLSMRNKFLKNSINSLCKTLEFLDLNQIKDFTEYKRTRQKSSYEIEFSDLENNYYEYEENKTKNNINDKYEQKRNNLINFMDFSKVLNI